MSPLGSETQLIASQLLRNGSLSGKDLAAKVLLARPDLSESQAANLSKDCLCILFKHNLVRAWQSEMDLITYYKIDEKECLMRLSIPRYLMKIKLQYGAVHQQIMEVIYIHGSLNRNEIGQLVEKGNVIQALEELIQDNYVTGAYSFSEGTSVVS